VDRAFPGLYCGFVLGLFWAARLASGNKMTAAQADDEIDVRLEEEV
jgi:hypothetical protein